MDGEKESWVTWPPNTLQKNWSKSSLQITTRQSLLRNARECHHPKVTPLFSLKKYFKNIRQIPFSDNQTSFTTIYSKDWSFFHVHLFISSTLFPQLTLLPRKQKSTQKKNHLESTQSSQQQIIWNPTTTNPRQQSFGRPSNQN